MKVIKVANAENERIKKNMNKIYQAKQNLKSKALCMVKRLLQTVGTAAENNSQKCKERGFSFQLLSMILSD